MDPREGSRGVALGGIPPDRPRGFVRVMGYGSFVIGHRSRVRDYQLRVTGYRSRVTDYRLRVAGCELVASRDQATPGASSATAENSERLSCAVIIFCLGALHYNVTCFASSSLSAS